MSLLAAAGPVATGVGSLPGTDPLDAAAWVWGVLEDLPHLPELPARGLGADAVGRAAAMLVDLPVEYAAGSWQVAAHAGADLQRARALLAEDRAALEVAAHGWSGPVKVQVLGPLTLAGALGRARGEAAVADPGLRRDVGESLAEGVRAHLAEVGASVPGASLVLQIDEPSLPALLAGRVATRSGWGRLAPLSRPEAEQLLARVVAAAPRPAASIVHCCASEVPVDLLAGAGAGAVAFDLDLLTDDELDGYAAAVDAGVDLVVGALGTSTASTGEAVARRVSTLWSRLGFTADRLRDRTVVCPACGLAGAGRDAARQAYSTVVEAALRLREGDPGPGQ